MLFFYGVITQSLKCVRWFLFPAVKKFEKTRCTTLSNHLFNRVLSCQCARLRWISGSTGWFFVLIISVFPKTLFVQAFPLSVSPPLRLNIHRHATDNKVSCVCFAIMVFQDCVGARPLLHFHPDVLKGYFESYASEAKLNRTRTRQNDPIFFRLWRPSAFRLLKSVFFSVPIGRFLSIFRANFTTGSRSIVFQTFARHRSFSASCWRKNFNFLIFFRKQRLCYCNLSSQ